MRTMPEERIKSLEDNHITLTKSHADEREALRVEIFRAQVDQKKIAYALNESEKTNSTLVYSTTAQSEVDGSFSDEAELQKRRLEKAQLLASPSENA